MYKVNGFKAQQASHYQPPPPLEAIANSEMQVTSQTNNLRGRIASFSDEDLIALDYLIWMGNGVKAAKAMRCDQSTISRKSLDSCKFFDIKLQKEKGEWNILGNEKLVNKQRELHQIYRLNCYAPKRLSLPVNFRGITSKYLVDGWHGYIDKILDPLRKLELLRQSVIDAVLCTDADEIPATAIDAFHSIHIDTQALQLISNKSLISGRNGRDISFNTLPVLVPGNNFWPLRTSHLRAAGNKLKSVTAQRYNEKSWTESINSNSAFYLGSKYDLNINPSWSFIGLPYTYTSQIMLITKQQLAGHEAIKALAKFLLLATQN